MNVTNHGYPTTEQLTPLAEYESRAEFVRIATSGEVQAIDVHREAGLAGQQLILTSAEDLAHSLGKDSVSR